jgi:hypothetical protein
MERYASIESQSDSLIGLLTAQCVDLENLLSLTLQERLALEANDFERLMGIIDQRASIGQRLEVYHRQIAELRSRLGQCADGLMEHFNARRAVQLIGEIQVQDALIRPLMLTARDEAQTQLNHLSEGRRRAAAYLRDGRLHAIACDEHA